MLCGVVLVSSALSSDPGALTCSKKTRERGQTFPWVQASTAATQGTSRGLPVSDPAQGSRSVTACLPAGDVMGTAGNTVLWKQQGRLSSSSSVFAQQCNGKILAVFAYPQPERCNWLCFNLGFSGLLKMLRCFD